MPESVLSLEVRRYECDRYSHVNNTVYLRYLQEAEGRLLAMLGLPEETSLRSKKVDIEYLSSLKADDRVEILGEVTGHEADRVQSAFVVALAADGSPAARARLETELLPAGAGRAAHSESAPLPGDFPPLQDFGFPLLAPPPPGVYRTRRVIRESDANPLGEVDPAVLLRFIDDCGGEVVAAHNWPVNKMLAHGFAIFLRRNQVEIVRPLRPGQEIEIATWVSDVRRVSALRQYTIQEIGEVTPSALVHALGVWVDLETGRPIRFPPGFIEDFASNLSPGT